MIRKYRNLLLFLSLLFFSITFMYMSPVLAIMGITQGIIASGLIFWLMMFVLSFFIGRFYCGYLCPMGGIQFCVDACLHKPRINIKYLRAAKFLFWLFWLGMVIFFSLKFARDLKVNLFFANPTKLPPYSQQSYSIYFGIIFSVTIMAIILGKRGMCYYFCPFSVFFMIANKIRNFIKLPSLYLSKTENKCVKCKACNRACPMSLDVMQMAADNNFENSECILCGSCIDACKSKVLKYSLKK